MASPVFMRAAYHKGAAAQRNAAVAGSELNPLPLGLISRFDQPGCVDNPAQAGRAPGHRSNSRSQRSRRRQGGDPSRHRAEQPPGRMALRHQEPAIAGTGPNILPVAVFATLVSAPARLSRSRPSVPGARPPDGLCRRRPSHHGSGTPQTRRQQTAGHQVPVCMVGAGHQGPA